MSDTHLRNVFWLCIRRSRSKPSIPKYLTNDGNGRYSQSITVTFLKRILAKIISKRTHGQAARDAAFRPAVPIPWIYCEIYYTIMYQNYEIIFTNIKFLKTPWFLTIHNYGKKILIHFCMFVAYGLLEIFTSSEKIV